MVGDVPEIGKNWWLFVVLGVICVVTGVLAIVWPGLTLLTLGIFAGIYLLVTAIMEIIDAIIGDPGRARAERDPRDHLADRRPDLPPPPR